VGGRVEVLLRHHGGLFDEAVFDGTRQRVIHHHVLERHRLAASAFGERGGRQLKAKQGAQLVQRPDTSTCPVAVRLVHDQHQIWQARQILEVALAEVFRKPLDLRCLAAANFRIDLRDVEDVDLTGASIRL
jgi:hypothetical protein